MNPKNRFPEISIPKIVMYNAEALKNTPVTAIKTAKRPINKILPESPSRYKTKTKPKQKNYGKIPVSVKNFQNKKLRKEAERNSWTIEDYRLS